MDTPDNENMPEEAPAYTLSAHGHPLVTGTQERADVELHTRSWLAQSWERIRCWLRASTYTPDWLTAPWNRPVVGYLFAILMSAGTIILTFLLMRIFPTFAFPGALAILAILGVALLWGYGPGLLATLLETVLLNFIILSPQFPWSLNILQHVFETCLLLAIGIFISLVTSRIEHARAEAVTAHLEAEVYRQRLHDLFMQAPAPIVVLRGPEHHFELANPLAMQNFGQREIVGKTAREAMPEYASHGFLQLLDQVYTTGAERSVKELYVLADQHGDGELKEQYFNMIYQPTRATHGEVDGVMVLSVDVTEQVVSRKRIEELVAQLEAKKAVLHKAQHRLQDSEHKLAERVGQLDAIFQAMVDGVIVFDDQGHMLHMNMAACDLLGLDSPPDYSFQVAGERPSPYDVRDEQRQPLFTEQWPLLRVLKGEVLMGTTATDVIIHTRDGRNLQLNVSGAPVRDQDEHIHGAVVVMRDVTERRRIEQRTHKALVALLAIAQLIGQGFEDTDHTVDENREQTELMTQKVAQRIAELTRSFLGCQRLSISIVEPETEILRPLAVVGLSPEQEHRWWAEQRQQESRMVDSPDQSLVQRLQANEVVLFDMTQPPWHSYPNPYGILTMLIAPMSVRDRLVGLLTLDYGGVEHLYTSEELALAGAAANLAATIIERDQLIGQRAELRANELALRETNQRMDEFLGVVSHELRTPLTTIKGNIQLGKLRLRSSLHEVPADSDVLRSMLEEIQMMLERAERHVNVQNRLIGDLLDISRLQTDKLELRLVPCDLATIVRETVEDQRSVTPKRTIHLELAEEEITPAIADAERIWQVLSNYLTNALKYSPADRPVDVQMKREDKMVRILVRDEGPGLTLSEQERIWERFYQVEGIKRQLGHSVGLGLGLHICREIVEQHQGEVGVESTKGEGSTFWFTLPLARE
jgi:PAS domain S-box-containing protein